MEADQYQVVWTPAAQHKLQEIVAEILEASPSRAVPFGHKIADLAGAAEILYEHLSEAIQYRSLDRQLETKTSHNSACRGVKPWAFPSNPDRDEMFIGKELEIGELR